MFDFLSRRFYVPETGEGGEAPPAPAPAQDHDPPQPPAQEAPPAAPQQPAGRPKLYDQLPKGRAIKESFHKYDTLDKLVAYAEEAEEKLGRAVVKPGKDAKPEEIKAFLASWGIPETPAGYELKADGMPPQVLEKLAKDYHKAGFSKTQATAAIAGIQEIMQQGKQAQQAAAAARVDAFKKDFLALYNGDDKKAQAGVFLAQKCLAKRIASKEAIERIEKAGLLMDPVVMKAFADLEASAFTDPAFVEGKGGGGPAPAGTFPKGDEWIQTYGGGK